MSERDRKHSEAEARRIARAGQAQAALEAHNQRLATLERLFGTGVLPSSPGVDEPE